MCESLAGPCRQRAETIDRARTLPGYLLLLRRGDHRQGPHVGQGAEMEHVRPGVRHACHLIIHEMLCTCDFEGANEAPSLNDMDHEGQRYRSAH